MHCNALQRTATHCNAQQHTAMHCSTLQHTASHCNTQSFAEHVLQGKENTLQHTTRHRNTLQHVATKSQGVQRRHVMRAVECVGACVRAREALPSVSCCTFSHSNTLFTLQRTFHTATHCSTLKHTATHHACMRGDATWCALMVCNDVIVCVLM